MNNINEIINQLTLEEKVALVSGTKFMFTNPIPRLKIPSVRVSDGPHGLRVQKEDGDNGVMNSEQATCFPPAVTTASSWNGDNAFKMGQAIAIEALHYGIDVVLGPGVCIKRNPLCGRNFEYFSEDPFLAGIIALGEAEGIQSKGVGTSVKHFALNNAENFRFMGDSICDDRAIREIYLKAFETIVKAGKPDTVMCAYNQLNGEFCSENKWLLNDVLRGEWGFSGLVMSDWGAVNDRVKGLKAGLDLEMPGDTDICRKWLFDAVNDGSLEIDCLDKAVERVLKLLERYEKNPKGAQIDWEKHNLISQEVAEDSAVLLKNDNALPLKKDEKILVVGGLFEKMRYQGAGSSMINPYKVTSPKIAFDNANVDYGYAKGYEENKIAPNEALIEQALSKAADFDKIVAFMGLTDSVESEGFDRENMRLPENQLALIDAITKTNKTIIVILFGGSPVELPFADKVSAILNMYLPGQNGGTATYNLLFGKSNPCGKLAETWAKNYGDVPFNQDYSKTVNEIYRESIFVGYRYYLTANKEVRFPFGFGLSYTTFDYSNMTVLQKADGYVVSCDVTNTGKEGGAEIVELYVTAPKCGVFKPLRELKGFSKVYLQVGQSKTVQIQVNKDDLRYWNVKENRWVLENGQYAIQLCSDCQTVKLSKTVDIAGETVELPYSEEINDIYGNLRFEEVSDSVFERMADRKIPSLPQSKHITMQSKFSDLKQTFFGNIVFKAVLSVPKKDMKKALKLPEGKEKDNGIKGAIFLKQILESNSLRSMTMSAGKQFQYNTAEGIMHLANGRIIKSIKCFTSKIKATALPKDKEKNRK